MALNTKYRASAPGSLMIMGEHAVLNGHGALVAAIDKRIDVTLIPRDDQEIMITSQLGDYSTSLNKLKLTHSVISSEFPSGLRFVLGAIKKAVTLANFGFDNGLDNSFDNSFDKGFELKIDSEFSDKIGFGSSAAVVIATLGVLQKISIADFDLLETAHSVVRELQGMGSGADLAASLYGGLLYYKPFVKKGSVTLFSYQIEKLPMLLPIIAVYSGSKIPTPEVVKQVASDAEQHPSLYRQIYDTIGECVLAGKEAIKNEDLNKLGSLMNIHHELLGALGVSNERLDKIMNCLKTSPGIYGAKISGAGLGDCVIGLGLCNQVEHDHSIKLIPTKMSPLGLKVEIVNDSEINSLEFNALEKA